jgi:hypothetical protein
MAMTSLTPDQIAANWAQGLAGATTKITAGVNAVSVSPGQAAARQKAVYVANVNANADKWASKVAAVPVQAWQQATLTKGIPRIATGAQAAQPKFATFMGQLLPYIQRQVQSLPPRGNLQQNIARMTQFVTGMSQFSSNGS